MASLRVLRGLRPGWQVALAKPDTILGRNPDCDVPIPIVTVSRRHAGIRRLGDRFVLRDLGSLNGTYVNSSPVSGLRPLTGGDHLSLAGFEAVFESPGTPCREATWLRSADPQAMMRLLRGTAAASRRKLWLLAAACRRQLGGPEPWFGAELAERYAEEAGERSIRAVELGDEVDLGATLAWEAAGEATAAPLTPFATLAGRDTLPPGAEDELWAALDKAAGLVVKARVDVGLAAGSPADLHQAKYARADAEIRLLRVKAKLQEEKR